MLLTEGQAKKRWCPMVRLLGMQESPAANTSFNRVPEYGDTGEIAIGCRCIGGDCMMWRSLNRRTSDGLTFTHESRGGQHENIERVGYCGLAGKPEGLK